MISQATEQSYLCTTTAPSGSAPQLWTLGGVWTRPWASQSTPSLCTLQGPGHLTPLLGSWQKVCLWPGLGLEGWTMAVT